MKKHVFDRNNPNKRGYYDIATASDSIAHFTFFAHTSQYFSTKITPSPTLNNASWVAFMPQVTQYLGFEFG